MSKVLILTRYGSLGASSRVRIMQYLPYLNNDIDIEVNSLFTDEMLEDFYLGKRRSILKIISRYLLRVKILLKQNEFDYLWIEKELFPYFPGWLEVFFLREKTTYYLDYDDAIFLNYDLNRNLFVRLFLKNKLRFLIKNANQIFVGNEYLHGYVSKWNSNVKYLYSLVNESLYKKKIIKKNQNQIVVGWIGSPSTTKYLYTIFEVLNELSSRYNFCLIAIGAKTLPKQKFSLYQIDWELQTEIENVQKFDIGIMPLNESAWENGKCGYKLIQYMAAGIPVIASPVGINKNIVTPDLGFLASDKDEWLLSFEKLFGSVEMRAELGKNARNAVEQKFSFSYNIQVFRKLFSKY